MKQVFSKLSKVFAWNDWLDYVLNLLEKFNSYSDKWKKLAVKTGKKNTYRALT